MHRLTVSLFLFLVILTAVVGLSWGIDQWYHAQFAGEEDPVARAYRDTGHLLAGALDDEAADSAQLHLRHSHLSPTLTPYDEFPLPQDLRAGFEAGEPLLLESGDQLSLHYFLPARQHVLSLVLPPATGAELSAQWRWMMTLLFYLGVVAIVVLWLYYPLLRRLYQVQVAAEAFGRGDLTARVQPGLHSYIPKVERAFNQMAQRIEQLVTDNKLLSQGVSHDLRTPLARLRFGLDVIAEADLPETQQRQLAHLNRDLMAMESLVEALLGYARLDQAQVVFTRVPVALGSWLQDWLHDQYPDQVGWHCPDEWRKLRVQVDPDYLAMALHNLIQNALRYGRGSVCASVSRESQYLLLVLEDDGPGIAAEDRGRLLKPFCRGKREHSGPVGHGLGLAVVERIALRHGASLQLSQSQRLGGLCATLCFSLIGE